MRGRRFCALMMTFALLSACGGSKKSNSDELALSMRTTYLSLTEITACAAITADYGDRVYQYEAQLSGNGETGEMQITVPEDIAGLTVAWENGAGKLEYDGASLMTGQLSPDGISPADAVPLILSACCMGAMLDSCYEELDGMTTLRVGLANPGLPEDSGSRIDVWVKPDDFTMKQAEVSLDNQTVIHIEFASFTWQGIAVPETK